MYSVRGTTAGEDHSIRERSAVAQLPTFARPFIVKGAKSVLDEEVQDLPRKFNKRTEQLPSIRIRMEYFFGTRNKRGYGV